MLIHKNCGTKVRLDLGDALKFVSAFGITAAGLKVNMVTMVDCGNNTGRAVFFCPQCKVTVPNEDLVIQCQHCGKLVPASSAVIPRGSGGAMCSKCGPELFGAGTSPLNISTFILSKEAVRR